MEEFEASDIVVQTRENEIPRLKHSCTPSTYKGVGEQVKFYMKYSKHGLVNQVASFKDLSISKLLRVMWCTGLVRLSVWKMPPIVQLTLFSAISGGLE